MYIYEHKAWPNFIWDEAIINNMLIEIGHLQGRLLGKMEAIGFDLRQEAGLLNLTQDVIKSSEIEGEKLEYEEVRSSIAKKLGIKITNMKNSSRNIDGVVDMLLDATTNFNEHLSEKRLFEWHKKLFPSGKNSIYRINVGNWRNDQSGAMQIISGPIGREKIHYVAPVAKIVKKEMKEFFNWFNEDQTIDLVLKSAIAHFWFVTIHPFDDGNGRIARALADMLLAKSDKSTMRFYSMSSQIRIKRKEYYQILEESQKGNLDITNWLKWYLNCLKSAISDSQSTLSKSFNKAKFWSEHSGILLNERQKKILNLLLDGFSDPLTSSLWAKLNGCSQDSAGRDINHLLKANILHKEAKGGRSTHYRLTNLL